jgi:hypothetical protein
VVPSFERLVLLHTARLAASLALLRTARLVVSPARFALTVAAARATAVSVYKLVGYSAAVAVQQL